MKGVFYIISDESLNMLSNNEIPATMPTILDVEALTNHRGSFKPSIEAEKRIGMLKWINKHGVATHKYKGRLKFHLHRFTKKRAI